VANWAGVVYVAFVIDAYPRRILGYLGTSNQTAKLASAEQCRR
jgi:hypothetical protein